MRGMLAQFAEPEQAVDDRDHPEPQPRDRQQERLAQVPVRGRDRQPPGAAPVRDADRVPADREGEEDELGCKGHVGSRAASESGAELARHRRKRQLLIYGGTTDGTMALSCW